MRLLPLSAFTRRGVGRSATMPDATKQDAASAAPFKALISSPILVTKIHCHLSNTSNSTNQGFSSHLSNHTKSVSESAQPVSYKIPSSSESGMLSYNVYSLLLTFTVGVVIQLVVASVKDVVAKPTWALPVSNTL